MSGGNVTFFSLFLYIAISVSKDLALLCTGSNGKLPGFLCCAKAQWQGSFTFPYELHSFEQYPGQILVINHYEALL